MIDQAQALIHELTIVWLALTLIRQTAVALLERAAGFCMSKAVNSWDCVVRLAHAQLTERTGVGLATMA